MSTIATTNSLDRTGILLDVHVLDGGLASELEYRGADIDGPLWSAHVLEEKPELVEQVHRAYIEAGADCILTASYQVSRMGYAETGLPSAQADGALLRAVELARAAAANFPSRRVVVAASLGAFGAALHDGAEYHGNYECSFADLVDFHAERIEVLAGAKGKQYPDLLAFETLPSLAEAQAIGEALRGWPELSAWLSFNCVDQERVAHGEMLRECAEFASGLEQIVAVGVNCTHPSRITRLIGEMRAVQNKPIVVYPNSGEGWNADQRCWMGSSDPAEYGEMAAQWFAAGAQIVGGCCRTRPSHVRRVADAARAKR